MQPRVLLTGFEPFGGAAVNPSWQAVALVAAEPPPGIDVTALELECVFGRSVSQLRDAINAGEYDLILCVGQAGGRADISVERVAINLDDARIPDNAGNQPVDSQIVAGGPDAYFAPLPVKACVAAVRGIGLPASVSHTAGTFVCNHVFYGLAHYLATERSGARGGFVHIPYAPEQVTAEAAPSMAVASAADGLRAILTAALETAEDLCVPEGTTH